MEVSRSGKRSFQETEVSSNKSRKVESFLDNLNKSLKCPDLSSIQELCSAEEFSQLQPSTTHFISTLTSQPYIGLIEEENLKILINFLVKLHISEGEDLKFQEKSKVWAVTQLKKSLCYPLSVLREKEYLFPVTLYAAVTKLVAVIANENIKKCNIPPEIFHLLCVMGNIVLKMHVPPSALLIESLILILYEEQSTSPIVQDLLKTISTFISEGKCYSTKTCEHFYTLYPLALESALICLLKGEKSDLNERILKSKLPEVCSQSPHLFQLVVNMIITAWMETKGHPDIASFLLSFVSCMDHSASINLISLFPDNLKSLLLLFQMPPSDLPPILMKCHAECIKNTLEEAVTRKLCQKQDVIILLLMFPTWHHILGDLNISKILNTVV